jgi:putative oxidoreductase
MFTLFNKLKNMEAKAIILDVLMAVYVVPAFIFGTKKLIGLREPVAHFKRWGYPLWGMHLLGFAEIACGVLLFIAPARIYAIVIYSVIIAGALYTHIKANDPKKVVMKPIFVGLHLLIIFLFTLWL